MGTRVNSVTSPSSGNGDSDNEDPFESALSQPSKFQANACRFRKYLKKSLKGGSPLYWYQIQAVLKTPKLVNEDDQNEVDMCGASDTVREPIIIVAPAGSGKSGIIVMLPYILESSKVLVLTPSKIITEQLSYAFGFSPRKKSFFEEIGLCREETARKILEVVNVIKNSQDITNTVFGNLVIVNAQKFGGRAKTSLVYNNVEVIEDVKSFFASFDTLIVDEAHHYPAATWRKIVEVFSGPGKKIIFLTATPYRTGPKGQKYFILGPNKEHRIAYEITKEDVEGKTVRHCEFIEQNHAMTSDTLAKDIKKVFDDHLKREPRIKRPQAMILVRTKVEARKIASDLNRKMNDPKFATAVLGDDCKKLKRTDQDCEVPKTPLDEFTEGVYRVAVTCGVGLEGYDNANVTLCVILRRITKSKIMFEQFLGRCRRLHHKLEGAAPDRTRCKLMSYPEFEQKRMWKNYEQIAEDDPSDDEMNETFSEQEETFSEEEMENNSDEETDESTLDEENDESTSEEENDESTSEEEDTNAPIKCRNYLKQKLVKTGEQRSRLKRDRKNLKGLNRNTEDESTSVQEEANTSDEEVTLGRSRKFRCVYRRVRVYRRIYTSDSSEDSSS